MPAAISGPRCRDIASVNAWNAGMNLLRSEKQQMFACKHWLIREATGPFCAEICLRSSQYQRTRSNKVVQNPGSYGAPVLKRASPFSGHPTASALPSWPQAAQTSEAGHLDVRHSCSMPLTMHSQGPEKHRRFLAEPGASRRTRVRDLTRIGCLASWSPLWRVVPSQVSTWHAAMQPWRSACPLPWRA